MRYHKISEWDTANGVGIGIVLWVSGCEHHCEGCHNYSTWDASSGSPFTDEVLSLLLKKMEHPHVSRLTLSGGDPLAPYNREESLRIAKEVKKRYPLKKIWCYTGYEYEQIKDLAIMKYIDVLVDGKYEKDKRSLNLSWCGSSNQKVIDIVATRLSDSVVLLDL